MTTYFSPAVNKRRHYLRNRRIDLKKSMKANLIRLIKYIEIGDIFKTSSTSKRIVEILKLQHNIEYELYWMGKEL